MLHPDDSSHAPARFYKTGASDRPARASRWLTYGLGARPDLPGFIVLLSAKTRKDGGKSCWAEGFSPTATGRRSSDRKRSGVFVSNPPASDSAARRASLAPHAPRSESGAPCRVGDRRSTHACAAYEIGVSLRRGARADRHFPGTPRDPRALWDPAGSVSAPIPACSARG